MTVVNWYSKGRHLPNKPADSPDPIGCDCGWNPPPGTDVAAAIDRYFVHSENTWFLPYVTIDQEREWT